MCKPRLCHFHWEICIKVLMDTLWEKHGAAFIRLGTHELCLILALTESPCVHMHRATWHNSPTVSVMDTTPSGDEYITRGGEEESRPCNCLSIIPFSSSLYPSAFTSGPRIVRFICDLHHDTVKIYIFTFTMALSGFTLSIVSE